jgi:hypothetical protein
VPARPWLRLLAATIFVALAALAAQRLFRLAAVRDPGFRARLATAADARFPSYPQFLEQVRAATKPGERIAIVFPATSWDGGYAYGYYRASYILSGREVMPLLSEQNVPLPANFEGASAIAAYRTNIPAGPYRVVFTTPDGFLVRR